MNWIKKLFGGKNTNEEPINIELENLFNEFRLESEKLIKIINNSLAVVKNSQIKVVKYLDDATKIKNQIVENIQKDDDEIVEKLTSKLTEIRQNQTRSALDLETSQENLDQTLELWELRTLKFTKKFETLKVNLEQSLQDKYTKMYFELTTNDLEKEVGKTDVLTEKILTQVHLRTHQ
jgi:hypothetical protein